MPLGFVSPHVVSYFAYGSNMHPAIFEGVRAIVPVTAQPAVVRDHRLAFNLLGGAAEPSFAGIEPAPGAVCHGVLYELTAADFARVSRGMPLASGALASCGRGRGAARQARVDAARGGRPAARARGARRADAERAVRRDPARRRVHERPAGGGAGGSTRSQADARARAASARAAAAAIAPGRAMASA